MDAMVGGGSGRAKLTRGALWLWCIVGALSAGSGRAFGGFEVPEKIALSSAVKVLLEDPLLSDGERRRLAIFHGQWERVGEPTVVEAAQIAWQRHALGEDVLVDQQVPVLLRARAALERGDAEAALGLVEALGTARGDLVKARALVRLGRRDQAVGVLVGWREKLGTREIVDAGELTAAGEMVAMLAGLQGRPGQDYGLAMSLFGKARGELDRLYWPALLAEARLLIEKDNPGDAVKALMEGLSLNPRSGEAWYELGRLAARGFSFATAERCVARLREINPEHPLAGLVEIDTLLTQKDGAGAVALCEQLMDAGDGRREVLARLAVGYALEHDRRKTGELLGRYERDWPDDGLAHYLVGRYLSLARQYAWGARVLGRAIEIEPGWARPRVELGLLLMQWGDESEALAVLRGAVRLDEFNRRAHNQLELAQRLGGYKQIQTEHFVIRYDGGDGAAEVLARDMFGRVEQIYTEVTGVFGYRPERRTVIEILPDKRYLGVRVVGMPDIWTIAACTGDVIAMVAPRIGKGQKGTFDWPTVVRHEFVHTVTLNQTGFRIPHWFTEGCGVWQEPGGFDYPRCRMLAQAVALDGLFSLEQIDWAFVRPKRPTDRGLAYAQAGWMIRYIVERFGNRALVEMLERFGAGASAAEGIEVVTGENSEAFLAGFLSWAKQEVMDWGLQGVPDDVAFVGLVEEARGLTSHLSKEQQATLSRLLKQYPRHPDLLWVAAKAAVAGGDPKVAQGALERYAAARPVDRWADRELVRIASGQQRLEQAVRALERLDLAEQESGDWAVELARVHRRAGRLDQAADAVRRALNREPFDADHRELAAAIDLQRGDMPGALRHVNALTLIEPDRARHWVRLAALLDRMGDGPGAQAAAERARVVDPGAPVGRFIGDPR